MGALDGKVAVVTGAAQGIGRAIADGLAAEGARIVVADLRGAEEAALTYDGGVAITADVSSEADVERLVEADLQVADAGRVEGRHATPAPRSASGRTRPARRPAWKTTAG